MSETAARLAAVLAGNLEPVEPNLLIDPALAGAEQTTEVFSRKWSAYEHGGEMINRMTQLQRQWYLQLYGFAGEGELQDHLRRCSVIIDCGTGTGNKAAWFASLSPNTAVVAVDISESVIAAARYYRERHPNLVFVRADIAHMPFLRAGAFDYVNCDQVIHHTAHPPETFAELVRITRPGGELTCYVYRRKALPRELLDEHFREYAKRLDHATLMQLSEQLTALGKLLSEAYPEPLEFPAIPALGIEGGQMTVQRFIYWNMLKCYWNPDAGQQGSVMTNFDWYAPSTAFRYSEAEFRTWIERHGLETRHFHREPACLSGRFARK